MTGITAHRMARMRLVDGQAYWLLFVISIATIRGVMINHPLCQHIEDFISHLSASV